MARGEELKGRKLGNGHFEIIELLGSGAFADVYRGRQISLHRDVAIKVLNRRAAEDEQLVRRFHHEASAIAQFDHPNIVKIIDNGEEGGLNYYIMNLLPRTLRSILERGEPLAVDLVIRVACQLAEALRYAQSTVQNFVHRDIKPENVMLDRDNNAVLSDFGLVRGEQFSKYTQEGMMVGTPIYMSPEQVRGLIADGRSDLYALGVLLYECATGTPPFVGDLHAVYYQHVNESPKPPRQLRREVPPKFEAIIIRLLSKAPGDRYTSAEELVAALQPFKRNLPLAKTASLSEQQTMTMLAGAPTASQTIPEAPIEKPPRRRPVKLSWVVASAASIALGGFLGLSEPGRSMLSGLFASSEVIKNGRQTTPIQSVDNLLAQDSVATNVQVDSTQGNESVLNGANPPTSLENSLGADSVSAVIKPNASRRDDLANRAGSPTSKKQTSAISRKPSDEKPDTTPPTQSLPSNVKVKVKIVATDESGEPVFATIFLNGQPTEYQTPRELNLPPGQYSIRVNKFEYELIGGARTITLEGGVPQRLIFVLRRLARN